MRCWSGCFFGGAVVEAGGGVMAHGRRLQAAMLLFQAAEREILPLPLSSIFFVLSFSVSFTSGCPFVLSVLFFFFLISLPGFKLPLNLSFLSLFRYSLFGHFPLCPPLLLALSVVFIGQRGAEASLSLCVGSDANLPCHGAELGSQRAWVCRALPL